MAPKRKGLGRGLDALIPNKLNAPASANDEKPSKKAASKKSPDEVKSKPKRKSIDEVNPVVDADKEENIILDSNVGNENTDNGNIDDIFIPNIEQNADNSSIDTEENQGVSAEPTDDNIKPEENKADDKASAAVSQVDKSLKKDIKDDGADKVLSVKISLVEPNREQPRKKFNEEGIEELAASIAQYGVIQPLLVQWKDSYYEIIAGERRWRAAMKAGLKEVPVIVKEYSNKEAVEISLIENIQREDLNPIEEALAYERLVEEFEMTQEQVAERVSKSRSSVTNSMRLLKLESDVREMVVSGDISEGHARTLLSLPTSEAQKLIADRIVKEKLSVRDTEKLVKKLVSDVKRPVKKRDYEKEAILGNLSEQLKNIFGTKVSISENSRHRGKIEIEYYSDDELNRIFELLQSIR